MQFYFKDLFFKLFLIIFNISMLSILYIDKNINKTKNILKDTNKVFTVNVCFSPEEHCLSFILIDINKAYNRVWLQGYSFSSKSIAIALINAASRGVNVQILLDKSQEISSLISLLLASSIVVLIDNIVGIAHNKIIIIDSNTIFTGSYNWTNAAEYKNSENIILIKNNISLVCKYEKNFIYRKSLSRNPY